MRRLADMRCRRGRLAGIAGTGLGALPVSLPRAAGHRLAYDPAGGSSSRGRNVPSVAGKQDETC